jgi:phosphopantetheinyl transferase
MSLFYIGLSYVSTLGEKKTVLHNEARRVLGLMDSRGPISIEAGGRPFFEDRRADFSISHSGQLAAVAWSEGGARVGCDAELLNPRRNHTEISRIFFHQAEQEYISAAETKEQCRCFYSLWVLKEAYLKMKGLSVAEMLKAPVFWIGGTRADPGKELPVTFKLYELAGEKGEEYLLAFAREFKNHNKPESDFPGEAASPEPEFCWFSEASLRISSMDEIYAAPSPENTARPKR